MVFNLLIRLITYLFNRFLGPEILDAVPETQFYQEPLDSILSTEEYVSDALNAGGWQCCCGRANPPYVSTCVCGINKSGQLNHARKEKLSHRTQYAKELQDKIDQCQLLYNSHFISQEEYEAEMERLTRFGPV